MELKTFDNILEEICDAYDESISPKKITRSNTNILYLIFKAISKGFEVINNIVVTLSNKFNPSYCSDEDLLSTSELVGTERIKAQSSGLKITAVNNGGQPTTISAGTYTYLGVNDISFIFNVLSDIEIPAGQKYVFLAVSNQRGRFLVTEQTDITVTSTTTIPEDITFSCSDNTSLLGREEETLLELRERIVTKVDRQDSFTELEYKINNLPTVFDSKVLFNNEIIDVTYDGYVIPPFHLLIFVSGNITNDIAETVAQNTPYPTVQGVEGIETKYFSDSFVNGFFPVYVNKFKKKEYTANIIYKIDEEYADSIEAEAKMRNALYNNFTGEVHTDYIKEENLYTVLISLYLEAVNILAVNLYVDGNPVDYVTVPSSQIPELKEITFTKVQ